MTTSADGTKRSSRDFEQAFIDNAAANLTRPRAPGDRDRQQRVHMTLIQFA
jgi:hypothetical protein